MKSFIENLKAISIGLLFLAAIGFVVWLMILTAPISILILFAILILIFAWTVGQIAIIAIKRE